MYNRIKYSLPIIEDSEMIFEKTIPIEYGLEQFGAISFTKGCYVGQEVISRTKHLGVIRKKLKVIDRSSMCEEYKICSQWQDKLIVLYYI